MGPESDTNESIRMDTGMDELATLSIARLPRDDTQQSISTGTVTDELPMSAIMNLVREASGLARPTAARGRIAHASDPP